MTGICEACQSFELPVTGGNVSLYNETEGEAVYPTPLIGVVGLVEHPEHETTQHWNQAGDVILLLGETEEELGASALQQFMTGSTSGCLQPSIWKRKKISRKQFLKQSGKT